MAACIPMYSTYGSNKSISLKSRGLSVTVPAIEPYAWTVDFTVRPVSTTAIVDPSSCREPRSSIFFYSRIPQPYQTALSHLMVKIIRGPPEFKRKYRYRALGWMLIQPFDSRKYTMDAPRPVTKKSKTPIELAVAMLYVIAELVKRPSAAYLDRPRVLDEASDSPL